MIIIIISTQHLIASRLIFNYFLQLSLLNIAKIIIVINNNGNFIYVVDLQVKY